MNRWLPYCAMFGASTLWASSGPGNKWILIHGAEVPEVIFFRILGGALVLWAIIFLLRKDYRGAGPMPILMGILEPGLVTLFIVWGVSLTSAVNAAVVWGIMPLTQPILARIFLKEPIRKSVALGACLAISGVVLLFIVKNQDGTGNIIGDLLLMCGVMSASINQLIARRVATTRREPIVTTAYQMITAAIIASILFLVLVPLDTAYAGVSGAEFIVLAYLIVTTAGPFFLYNYALQYLEIGRVALFSPVSGPLGVFFATLIFQEPLNGLIIVAIMIAISGVCVPLIADRLYGAKKPE